MTNFGMAYTEAWPRALICRGCFVTPFYNNLEYNLFQYMWNTCGQGCAESCNQVSCGSKHNGSLSMY